MARNVVANITLSLDGRVTGTGGDYDMSWIVPHASSGAVRDHMIRFTGPATTAVLGRKNYEGFGGFWPAVAEDESADPRDRAFSRWLNEVEKVVISSTATEPKWANTRIENADPTEVVTALREQDGGDIVVLNSISVIRALLEADAVDTLSITLCPELVGGGRRLFEDGLPGSSWRLRDSFASDRGALCLRYDRVR